MSLNSITRKKSFFTLICLFVYSAIIPMQLSDYVLCIGEDGHIRFAYAGYENHGCCQDHSSHACNHTEHDHDHEHTEHEHEHTEHEHCGNCLDLPIFACINTETTIITDAKKPISPTIVSIGTLIPHEAIDFSVPPIKPLTLIPPLIDPTLKSLRTVMLLI
ncbi:hypothetical protein F4X73_00870 [Candidatus Poribacteria bacterium]|nr:hypothetical protein [Candidatus Poribacteria bacterium]